MKNCLISNRLQISLNKSIQMEFSSAMIYYAMSSYLRSEGLKHGAELFTKWADEEMGHGKKLIEYLDDRNCLAKIEGADSATNSFKSLEEMLNAGYEHEVLVSNNYIKISSIALSEDDNTTFHFLSWYINEQKEEVIKFRDLIDAYNNIGDTPERKYLMDKVFKHYL